MRFSDRPDIIKSDGGTALLAVTIASLVMLTTLLVSAGLGGATLSQLLWVAAPLFLVGFPVTFFIGILVAGFIGLPLTYLLAKFGWERPWVYPLAGAVVGTIVAALIVRTADPLEPVLLGSLPGLAAGIVWWRYNRRYLQETGD
jgi:hypothetical protein